jgi:hypothetical protein
MVGQLVVYTLLLRPTVSQQNNALKTLPFDCIQEDITPSTFTMNTIHTGLVNHLYHRNDCLQGV